MNRNPTNARRTAGTILALWAVALVFCALAFLTGCASPKEVTTAVMKFASGTNELFTITQPKDTSFDRAEYTKPDGSRLVVENYRSTANAAAIEAVKAQANAQKEVTLRAMELVKEAGQQAAQSQGIPVGTRSAPPAASAVPSGMKLVPVDDPSTPQPEIPQ